MSTLQYDTTTRLIEKAYTACKGFVLFVVIKESPSILRTRKSPWIKHNVRGGPSDLRVGGWAVTKKKSCTAN